jgi:hypothetical protein
MRIFQVFPSVKKNNWTEQWIISALQQWHNVTKVNRLNQCMINVDTPHPVMAQNTDNIIPHVSFLPLP